MAINFNFLDPLSLSVSDIKSIPFGYATQAPFKPTFININKTKSFKQSIVNGILTQLNCEICSEIILVNRTGVDIEVYDQNRDDEANSFLLRSEESATFRGLTNSCDVSAKAIGGSGDIYYRTQFFSNNPSR